MLTQILQRAVALAVRQSWRILGAVLLLVLGSGAFAVSHFDMSTDTVSLISPETEWRRNEAAVSKAFPRVDDSMAIVIDGKTPELAEDAAIRLVAAMAEDRKNFSNASRPDGGAFFDQNGLLFGSLGDVQKTTQQLIDAQPMLGTLAYDPSLRGIANSLASLVEGAADDPANPAINQLEAPLTGLHTAISTALTGKPSFFSWQQLISSDQGDLKPQSRRVVLTQPVYEDRKSVV